MERPGVVGGMLRCRAPGVAGAGVAPDLRRGVAGGSIEADGEPCLGGGVEVEVVIAGELRALSNEGGGIDVRYSCGIAKEQAHGLRLSMSRSRLEPGANGWMRCGETRATQK